MCGALQPSDPGPIRHFMTDKMKQQQFKVDIMTNISVSINLL